MLYSEIIAVCSQIHTKHLNTLCGRNVEFLMLNPVVHIAALVKKICVCAMSKIKCTYN
jgi:hypothetical protein